MNNLDLKDSFYIESSSYKFDKSRLDDFWDKVEVKDSDECWIWKGYINPDGYGQLDVGGKTTGAHRVAVRADGRDPTGKVVRHTCHNPSCVNPHHLVIGTQKENVQDMVEAGHQARGERHGQSELSADQVREIRASDRSPKELAHQYPTSASNIRAVREGEAWVHVD